VAINLTLGMRILLHLSAFDPSREGYDLPPDVTQQGIADVLCVRQSDVSRALSRMKHDGQVEERSSSIGPGRTGRKQRLKVYFLSARGLEMARVLASRIQETAVTLPPGAEGESPRTIRIRDLNQALGTTHSLLGLADLVSPDGTIAASPAARKPEQAPPIPEPAQGFVGRDRELSILAEKARSGPETVLVVVGVAGVGKTTLARKLIAGLRDRPCFYFQVRGWASSGRLLQSLRDFLFRHGRRRLAGLLHKSGPPQLKNVVDALGRDLEGLGALLVLDDFHESDGQPELGHLARELLELLPRLLPPCRLVLFSRTAPGLYDRRHTQVRQLVWEMPLGGLDEKSALELARRSGVTGGTLESVFRTTRGHPLSILLLKGAPPDAGAPGDAGRFIQEEVIGKLPPGERAMLQQLSVLRRPEGSEMILGISDDPLGFDALSALVSRSLVVLDSARYEVHEMVREAACGRTPAQARRAIHARAAELYLRTGGIDTGAEAVFHFFKSGEPERAARLLLSLGGELIAAGELEECRFLLDLVDAGKHGEADGLRRLRQDLLSAYGEWDLGYEYLFQCSVLSAATGLKLERPGLTTRSEKEWQEALSDHERGLQVLAGAGDTAGQCELLSSLGWMRLLRGETRQAEEAYRSILAFPKAEGCREATLKAQLGLGCAAWLSGKKAAAATRYRVTLRKLGPADAAFRIAALNYLANLACAEKELAAAAGLLEEAVGLCKTGRHRRERAYTLLHLGRVQSMLGKTEVAGRTLCSALAEFRGIGDIHGCVFSSLALAVHLFSRGENSRARELSESAAQESVGPELISIREHALRLAEMAGRTEKGRSESQRKASG